MEVIRKVRALVMFWVVLARHSRMQFSWLLFCTILEKRGKKHYSTVVDIAHHLVGKEVLHCLYLTVFAMPILSCS